MRTMRELEEDLRHDIILRLAQAQLNLDGNGGGQLSDVAMLRIASYEVADCWRTRYKLTNGLDDKTWLLGYPKRLIDIGYKIREVKALSVADRKYLWKWRRRGKNKASLRVTI